MKKILILAICACLSVLVTYGLVACKEKEPSYDNGYKINFDLSWEYGENSSKFSIGGTTKPDSVIITCGEKLDDKLPDYTTIPAEDLDAYDFIVTGWYFTLNGEKKEVTKDTVFSPESIGVPLGKEITLKLEYTTGWSPAT